MTLTEIKNKLEKAYNEENWTIIEDLLEALSYQVENESLDMFDDEYGDDEID
tara:strand:+ start:617 stop:772 length:156 start_codon:yes stop_codon:yes gene_type:complete